MKPISKTRCPVLLDKEIVYKKTSLLLETIALNQKKDPNHVALWLESENSLQQEYICDTFGIDPSRFFFIDHSREGGESAIDLLESILATGVIDMAVINSLKMLVPSEEFRKSLSEHVVGVDLGAPMQ